MIFKLLDKLIDKKFYEDKEEIVNKCSVFFAMNILSEEEYSTLILKIEQVYFVVEDKYTNITEY